MSLSRSDLVRIVDQASRYGVKVSSFHYEDSFEVRGLDFELVNFIVDCYKTKNHFVDGGDAAILCVDESRSTRNGTPYTKILLCGADPFDDLCLLGASLIKRLYREFKDLCILCATLDESSLFDSIVARYELDKVFVDEKAETPVETVANDNATETIPQMRLVFKGCDFEKVKDYLRPYIPNARDFYETKNVLSLEFDDDWSIWVENHDDNEYVLYYWDSNRLMPLFEIGRHVANQYKENYMIVEEEQEGETTL